MRLHFLEDAAAISSFTIYDDNKGNNILLNSIQLELSCLLNECKTNVSGLSKLNTYQVQAQYEKKKEKDCPIVPQSLQWLETLLFTRHGLMSQTCFHHRRNSATQRVNV